MAFSPRLEHGELTLIVPIQLKTFPIFMHVRIPMVLTSQSTNSDIFSFQCASHNKLSKFNCAKTQIPTFWEPNISVIILNIFVQLYFLCLLVTVKHLIPISMIISIPLIKCGKLLFATIVFLNGKTKVSNWILQVSFSFCLKYFIHEHGSHQNRDFSNYSTFGITRFGSKFGCDSIWVP